MALQAGIVGLPNVGKSTLFNALTAAGAQAANYPFCTIEPNVGTITVPDDRLTQLAPVFLKNKFMLGDNFSMLDVAIAPLLWRLDHYGIDLSKNAAPLLKYAERIFSRPAYIEALTPSEKVMRK